MQKFSTTKPLYIDSKKFIFLFIDPITDVHFKCQISKVELFTVIDHIFSYNIFHIASFVNYVQPKFSR